MKKLILVGAALLATSLSGFCQFTNTGYKNIKLQMSKQQLKTLTNADVSKLISNNDEHWPTSKMTILVDNVPLEVTYLELREPILLSISSTSPKAKIKGFSSELIGKKLSEVKTIMGAKLEPYYDEELIYVYDMQDPQSTLNLEFDENEVLVKIYCTLNQ